MKEKIRKTFLQLFATHIGRILVGAILFIIGGIMSPNGSIGEYIYDYDEGKFWLVLFYIGGLLWVGECMLFIVYGLIINPIKALRDKIKKKK